MRMLLLAILFAFAPAVFGQQTQEAPIVIDIGRPVPADPDYKEAGRLLEKAGKQHQGAIVLMIFTSIGAATYAVVNQSKPEALGHAVIAVGVAQIIGTFINLSAGSKEKQAGWILQGLELER